MTDLAEEQWRPIPGYEGAYEVSDAGRVRTTRRRGSRGGLRKLHVGKGNGYWTVVLRQPGGGHKAIARTVHSLVMAAFVGPCPEGMEVRHLDGNRLNASLSNLAYSTHTENLHDRRKHGTDHNAAKTHCPQGHPYDEANTYSSPSRPGTRACRVCHNERSLAAYHARRAQGLPRYGPARNAV